MNYNNMIGSVSSGTMRPEDLIPSFLSFAQGIRMSREDRKSVREIAKREAEEGYDYDSEDSGYDLESLFDILGNYAPPYFYFGAHPSDGADYGYWLSEDFEHNFVNFNDGLKVNGLEDVPRGYTGEVLEVNDHGNCTLWNYNRGRKREVWSVV